MTLLWLDLETTGLELGTDRILEVGWKLTTDDLIEITAAENRVIRYSVPVWKNDVEPLLDPENIPYQMHDNSGLLTELLLGGDSPLHYVDELIVEQIADAGIDTAEPIKLAGIGVHFDKAWVDYWLPLTSRALHYRIYEVSTMKAFFADLGIEPSHVNPHPHRAQYDVVEGLENAREFRARVAHLLELEQIVKDA